MEATDHHPSLDPNSAFVGTPTRTRRPITANNTPSQNPERWVDTSSSNPAIIPLSKSRSLFTRTSNHAKLEPLGATYANLMLYALCYQLQRPVEPFLVANLLSSNEKGPQQSTAKAYGNLQSFFSAIQTIGSPLVGILLDRVGVRLASAAVFASCAASYAVLAGATSLGHLFLSKIPAVLQHAFLVAQATAAVSTAQLPMEQRAQALGRMTTAYTVGATFGPLLGGWLAERGDLYLGAKLAVLVSDEENSKSAICVLSNIAQTIALQGSLISVVISLAFLPNPMPSAVQSAGRKSSMVRDIRASAELLSRASLWPLLSVKVLSGVSSSMFQTALPLILTQQMRYDASSLGLVYSSSMLVVACFGAFGISWLIRVFGAAGLAGLSLLARAFIVLGLAAVVTAPAPSAVPTSLRYWTLSQCQVVGSNILIGIASHALATSLTTQTTGAVEPGEQGALLGLEHALFSLARIGGPPLGSWLLSFQTYGVWAVAVGCGIIDLGLFVLLPRTSLSSPSSATIVGSQPVGMVRPTPVKTAYQE